MDHVHSRNISVHELRRRRKKKSEEDPKGAADKKKQKKEQKEREKPKNAMEAIERLRQLSGCW